MDLEIGESLSTQELLDGALSLWPSPEQLAKPWSKNILQVQWVWAAG